ncbi:MAG: acetylornithine/succinylornithine family transaminase [Eggerthellaceae bacterium]|nr:acetylornithine/succinylornithine family transaminase [Eggerthellaceae bacterium]
MSLEEQKSLESAYVMGTFARKPVEFTEGRGMVLVDAEGREYLDFLSGIGCDCLGHCPPALVEALDAQAGQLIHVSNYFYIEHRGQVARHISDLVNRYAPEDERGPWKSFFTNSGAESNECAIKLARLHARRRAEAAGPDAPIPYKVVTVDASFHGRTMMTLAATAQPKFHVDFAPMPDGFLDVPRNDVAALEALFEAHGPEICAVMLECVQGESGVHPMTPEFLAAARRLTRAHGALLICDEVQCGVFRTGRPFGFQHYGVTPDVIALAKGIAGGFPAGACAARAEVADLFTPGDHGTTFGGSCLAMAAAEAVLDELDGGGYEQSVTEAGEYLRERLAALPHVHDVRGLGLMVGCDLDDDAPSAPEVVSAALEAGFVLNATGPRTLRFLPPLICGREHIDALADALAALL